VDGRARREREAAVEVEIEVSRIAAARDDGEALVEGGAQLLEIDVRRALGGEARHLGLHHEPRFRELRRGETPEPQERVKVTRDDAGVQRAHEVPARRSLTHLEEPAVLERAQRFADGHATGAEAAAQLTLGRKPVAVRESSLVNRTLDVRDDVVVHARCADGGKHQWRNSPTKEWRSQARVNTFDGQGPSRSNTRRMTKSERVAAALSRRPVDRPPVAFWRHVPEVDHTARGLADAMLAFHRRWDLDLIKVMSSGVYCLEDWGLEVP